MAHSAESQLEVPVLLIAMPQVQDPLFHQSVVLLVHHDDEGSFGLIVNRPTDVTIADVLAGMEIEWGGHETAPAYFGGPVMPQMGSVLYSNTGAPQLEEPDSQVETLLTPEIRMTHDLEQLKRLAAEPPASMRLFLGHSGWGAGQLVEEILRDDWLTAPADPELLFGGEPQAAWRKALVSVGVDPDALPSWTAGSSKDEKAN